MRHIVWDWNGTLLDDQHLVVGALRRLTDREGLPPVTPERYRALYCRPVRVFYEKLFDRAISDAEWADLDETYHAAYGELLATEARLAADAMHALERADRAGRTQSLLSMYRHHELVPLIERFSLHERFVRVDGLRGPGGVRKAGAMVEHLRAVAHVTDDDPRNVVVIGDAVDDAHAAQHVGAHAILVDGGSHPREELEATGVLVVDTLTDALDAAEID